MPLLRAVAHARAPLALTLLSLLSCGGVPYGGERCRAITLDTKPSSLPLGAASPVRSNVFMISDPFILGTGEMGCCVNNADFTARADCSKVDCEQLRQTLTVAKVGGAYVNEPCGAREGPLLTPRGVGSCDVYLAGDVIVGVGAFCFD